MNKSGFIKEYKALLKKECNGCACNCKLGRMYGNPAMPFDPCDTLRPFMAFYERLISPPSERE